MNSNIKKPNFYIKKSGFFRYPIKVPFNKNNENTAINSVLIVFLFFIIDLYQFSEIFER